MSLTFLEARDEMLTMFRTAWMAANPTYPIVYDDYTGTDIPKTSTPWCRVTIRHNRGEQDTLSNPIGKRLFSRDGLIAVQVFAPRGAGLTAAYILSKVAADAFEGQQSPGGVWFRSVRIREIGPDGNWFQINVLADFEYSEAK